MRVNIATEYSLIIMISLADRHESEDGPLAARELAEREGLPTDFTEQILLKLRRHGLVASTRGARGGYSLARPPALISVHDVMMAAEQQTFEINCDTHQISTERCASDGRCSIRPVWTELQGRIDTFLQGISLADLGRGEADVRQLVAMGAR